MADGIIQKEEYEKLEQLVKNHPWGKEIKWSFDYEKSRNNSIDELYNKVISYCHQVGPRNEYQFLLEILAKVASASDGIDEKESKIINRFTTDLTNRFKNDLDKLSK